ncbi:MAG TPA: WYL domain-containing protein [Actinomycetota bacterium]|jgi:predicted DNA-binding transcriptional regulator YafY
MRRIERLINLIAALLEAPQPIPVDEIRTKIAGYEQDEFDAFRRAFERDKEALRAMGIPIELVRDVLTDQAEGYIIRKESYYLPQLDLEADEVAALRLAADAVLGAGDEAASGLLKLSVDQPLDPLGGPKIVWGADVAAEQPLVPELYAALLVRHPVSFEYEGGATRRLETYALLHRRGQWYVVGRDLDRDALRSFKLSRIVGAIEVLDGTYEIPGSFDAAAQLGDEAWERGPDQAVAVTVRFPPSLTWWTEQNMSEWPSTPRPDGARDVQLQVGRIEALVAWIIERGSDVEIVAPQEARTALVEHLRPFLEEHAR